MCVGFGFITRELVKGELEIFRRRRGEGGRKMS